VSGFEVAVALAAALDHSVGALHGHPAELAAALAAAPPGAPDAPGFYPSWDAAICAVTGEDPDRLGITVPRLAHRTPRGSVNWDLSGATPRAWIERSKPGCAAQGAAGIEVATWFVGGFVVFSPRAEARHLAALADLIRYADPSAAAKLDAASDRMRRLEGIASLRRELLAIDPMRHPIQFDAAHDALCAAECAP
jgi:hypothetical protein